MPWVVGGAVLGGALLSSNASRRAAGQQAGASREAIALQREMYEQQRGDLAPYRQVGYDALDALRTMVGLPVGQAPAVQQQPQVPASPDVGTGQGAPPGVGDGGMPGSFGAGSSYNFVGGAPLWGSSTTYGTRLPRPVATPFDTNFLGGMGGRQFGGPMSLNQTYMTGEDGGEIVMNGQGNIQDIVGLGGPEVYTADMPGTVIPSMNTQEDILSGGNPDAMAAATGTPATVPPVTQTPAGQPEPEPFNWQTSPGYEFRLQQALEAQEASAGARGGLFSGAAIQGREALAQGIASDEYTNVYNRLAAIAGIGQTGVSQGVQAGSIAANQMGAGLQNIGAAQAAGTMGSAGAWGNALGQFGFLYGTGAFG